MNRKKFPPIIVGVRMFADFAAVCVIFAAGFAAYHAFPFGKHDPRIDPYLYLTLFAGVLFVAIFKWIGLYAPGRSSLVIAETKRLFNGFAAGALILTAVSFFSRVGQEDPPSRLVLLYSLVLCFPALRLERFLITPLIDWLQVKLGDTRRALIVGKSEIAKQLSRALERHPSPKYTLMLHIDADDVPLAIEQVQGRAVDAVFAADRSIPPEKLFELQRACEQKGAQFSYVPDMLEFLTEDVQFTEVDGVPLVTRRIRGRRLIYAFCKRTFDLFFAIAALIVLSPFFLLLAVAVKRGSPGPVFFCHERIGKDGRPFKLYKFRTMFVDTNPYAPSPKTPDDPRITPLGRFLRRKSLDELPQLFNIINSEMSVVGPRPEMPYIVENYTPGHRVRLQAKPGLTGIWQISAHRDSDIHEVMDYDVYYVENQSFILDMLIIFETGFYMLSGQEGC